MRTHTAISMCFVPLARDFEKEETGKRKLAQYKFPLEAVWFHSRYWWQVQKKLCPFTWNEVLQDEYEMD